jgi:hypothetical protein
VILNLDREPPGAGNEARPFGDRPALHHPVELEPQIVMQLPRGVLLNDVLVTLATTEAPARLGRQVKLSLPMVDFKAQDTLSGCDNAVLPFNWPHFLEVPYHLRSLRDGPRLISLQNLKLSFWM